MERRVVMWRLIYTKHALASAVAYLVDAATAREIPHRVAGWVRSSRSLYGKRTGFICGRRRRFVAAAGREFVVALQWALGVKTPAHLQSAPPLADLRSLPNARARREAIKSYREALRAAS